MDSHQPPPLPHATTTANGRALENLKSLLIKCAIASAPAKSLSRQQNTFIEKRIQEFLPTIHNPDHPPYAWIVNSVRLRDDDDVMAELHMIENAIKQLNEEGASSDEAAISEFILEEHTGLPWAHAALLNHHLKRLSKTGNITKTNDGCYFIGTPSVADACDPMPVLRITCKTSRSHTPSLSPVSSSSPTYASSDTSQSFDLKRGRKKKRNCRKKKQNARGMITHPKYKQARARRGGSRGRGRGRGRQRSYGNSCKEDMMKEASIGEVADDTCMDGMRVVDIQYLLTEDEATDENIQRKELPQAQATKDYVSQQQQIMVIEPLEQNVGDGRKLTSEPGSKKVRQRRRNIHSRHKPQTGNNMNLLEANMVDIEIQYVNRMVQEEGDSMDELIDEVYNQLTEPTETLCSTIDGEAAEENLQRKELHQVGMNQEAVNLECQAERSSMVIEIGPQQGHIGNEVAGKVMEPLEAAEIGYLMLQSEGETGERSLSREGQSELIEIQDHTEMKNEISLESVANQTYDIYDVEPQSHERKFTDDLKEQQLQETKFVKELKYLKADQGICIEEQNQHRKLRPRRSRNESTNTADRSKSSNARRALRRRN